MMTNELSKCKGVMVSEYDDPESIASSLDVDNILLDGMSIESRVEGNRVVTEVDSSSMETLLNTLDDLIRCQMAAEEVLC